MLLSTVADYDIILIYSEYVHFGCYYFVQMISYKIVWNSFQIPHSIGQIIIKYKNVVSTSQQVERLSRTTHLQG